MWFACSTAAITLWLLPLVEWADQQIARPRQRFDLAGEYLFVAEIVAIAVNAEVSVVSAIAGSPRRWVSKRQTISAAMCWASPPLPPLPHRNIRLP